LILFWEREDLRLEQRKRQSIKGGSNGFTEGTEGTVLCRELVCPQVGRFEKKAKDLPPGGRENPLKNVLVCLLREKTKL